MKGRFVWPFLVTVSFLFLFIQNSSAALGAWAQIEGEARGQTIYFNAWGGSEPINDYVSWASRRAQEKYGIEVKHVKVTDIAEVVGRLLVEKSAGRLDGGRVDLLWINGENFQQLKKSDLLYQVPRNLLPNAALVDWQKPTVQRDFTVPVDGYETPWGMAQLVFMYDTDVLAQPPHSMEELLVFAEAHPGRFTYPAPPSFYGTAFLKQLLLESISEPEALLAPVKKEDFSRVTAPLWHYLDRLHPLMWRKGNTFVTSSPALVSLLDNREIFIAYSFNPNEASRAIENGELPDSVRTYVHSSGSLANTHFLAVPRNSSNRAAALVFINMLLSPEAQAQKSDLAVWGDPTVLAMEKLNDRQKALFIGHSGPATLSAEELGRVYPEPHPSWTVMIEEEWQARYGHR
ncbi:ABC transporter substrate-binding protein [Desulfotalea psychrophila]|uniref:ABC transporter substrate-binding protein n=1 Tax=Desulfotalea psychrophila TaxID=84980 RepID=UPI00031F1DF0|nr:ABC transporter substrate-binding protein [Desulfotalea psychrophila]